MPVEVVRDHPESALSVVNPSRVCRVEVALPRVKITVPSGPRRLHPARWMESARVYRPVLNLPALLAPTATGHAAGNNKGQRALGSTGLFAPPRTIFVALRYASRAARQLSRRPPGLSRSIRSCG